MDLIIGGAYQGKSEYAHEKLGVEYYDIFKCGLDADELNFDAPGIQDLENFVLACMRAGKSALAHFKANRDEWEHCVLIANDISQGVVPIDAEMRAWREETGRLLTYLAGEARHVHRVFCGIGQVIK